MILIHCFLAPLVQLPLPSAFVRMIVVTKGLVCSRAQFQGENNALDKNLSKVVYLSRRLRYWIFLRYNVSNS
jgi:hypothetical protein